MEYLGKPRANKLERERLEAKRAELEQWEDQLSRFYDDMMKHDHELRLLRRDLNRRVIAEEYLDEMIAKHAQTIVDERRRSAAAGKPLPVPKMNSRSRPIID